MEKKGTTRLARPLSFARDTPSRTRKFSHAVTLADEGIGASSIEVTFDVDGPFILAWGADVMSADGAEVVSGGAYRCLLPIVDAVLVILLPRVSRSRLRPEANKESLLRSWMSTANSPSMF